MLILLVLGLGACSNPTGSGGGIPDGVLLVTPGGAGLKDGSSWANASPDIQAMIDLAAGDTAQYTEIWVAAGTYTPADTPAGAVANDLSYPLSDRDRTFWLKPGVKLYGGFSGTETARAQRTWTSNVTILSGDLNGDDGTTGNGENAYHVVLGLNLTSGTVLDGFTIKGGNGNAYGSSITVGSISSIDRSYGGGMYNAYSSSPVLTNVTISGNSAAVGGGMYNNFSSSPVLTNVTISGNSAAIGGGGMYNSNSSSPVLTNVTISGNSASYGGGGGMYNASSSPVLTNVIISGNSATSSNGNGGGMSNNASSSPVLTNVSISGNSASYDGGGMLNGSSSPVLTNVTISGNSAGTRGGGVYNISSSPVLTNVTISGNSAGTYGGGMSNWSSSAPAIRNSIVWGNTAYSDPTVYNSSSTPVFSNSIVQGSGGSLSWASSFGTDGGNNLATDPEFVDWIDPAGGSWVATAGGDYRLDAGSPAIDAGNNGNYPANADDTSVFPAGLSDAAKAAINAALPYDRDGTARKKGGTIDMGAYEKQ